MPTDFSTESHVKVIAETKAGFLTVITVYLPHPTVPGYHYETRLHGGYDPKIHDIVDRALDMSDTDAQYTHQEMCQQAYGQWGLQAKVILFWILDRIMNRGTTK